MLEVAARLSAAVWEDDNARAATLAARALVHQSIVPYFEDPANSNEDIGTMADRHLSHCILAYTGYMDKTEMNAFEWTIGQAFEQVLLRTCSWEFTTFLSLDRLLHDESKKPDIVTLGSLLKKTIDLLADLGWDNWDTCPDQCTETELCYIPMWPVVFAPGMRQGGIYGGEVLTEEQMARFWIPKCLSKEDWDCGGTRGREPAYQIPST